MKTINLEPYHIDHKSTDKGFVLTFHCKTVGGKMVKVNFDFGWWWITYIAAIMWKLISARQEKIDCARASMKGPS